MFSIIDEGIRHRLVQARVAAGVTQGYVARRLSVSEATYGRYERGEQPLSASRLGHVAGVLGVSVQHLLGHEPSQRPDVDRLVAAYTALDGDPLQERVLQAVLAALGAFDQAREQPHAPGP